MHGTFLGPHHLLYQPDTPEGFVLGAVTPVRQRFAFSAELPGEHPLFTDLAAPFHDLLLPVESLRQAALFAAHQYFRVPERRHAVIAEGGATVTDLTPWRRTHGANGSQGAQLALELELTPVDVVRGVPRGLEADAVVSIGGHRCATARARLVFATPGVYRSHRAAGLRESAAATAQERVRTSDGAPEPHQVGRVSARNVLLGPPTEDPGGDGPGPDDGTLLFPVDTRAAAEALQAMPGELPPALFLEASRQAALVAAAGRHGFAPAHSVMTHWHASFRGFAELGHPLWCEVRHHSRAGGGGEPARDAGDRPTSEWRLVFSQGNRTVARIHASVLQDCQ
ncbi:AfsA-related hotdog domain-containing protein [Streptomyces sp. NPDC048172]|uniref:AfsA-related hotdog domain-containing protein n=1 Tax=Streptomyces sp. NPDC048172 TaxID=3365505 RepID=UPI003721E2CB